MSQPNYLITAALPYANGEIHLGHLVEYIQADIMARFLRLTGHNALYICGSDAHGTPIMLKAEEKGETPDAMTVRIQADQAADLAAFHVAFDNFHSTHSPENEALVTQMYQALTHRGDIITKTISQAFDPEREMFLPDRYVRGECPRCHALDQYGDNCEQCGASYLPTELINPISSLSGKAPVYRETEHFFFDLEPHRDFLKSWLESDALPKPVANKLKEWFEGELRPWDISRDAPYFGFNIPGYTDKYFYVWLDAPIGYMASLKALANRQADIDFDHYWKKGSDSQLYHFIGKDIVYFHGLFWPAMLKASGHRLPSKIFTHGYLTLNGEKMSKSRGTFITGKTYRKQLDSEYLRYYYAAKLNTSTDDIDLNLEDFMQRVNADLIGKYVNIASRCAGFLRKHFDNQLADTLADPALFAECVSAGDDILNSYASTDYARAMRQIMAVADRVNQYIDAEKPWVRAKTKPVDGSVQAVATMGINLFRVLTIYLSPILPNTTTKVCQFLNVDTLTWEDGKTPLLNHQVNDFKPLLTRITPEAIDPLQPKQPVES